MDSLPRSWAGDTLLHHAISKWFVYQVADRLSSTDSMEERIMFYSASTALMLLLEHAEEPARAGRRSPASRGASLRWPRLRLASRVIKPAGATARESAPLQPQSAWQQEPQPPC